MRVADDNRSLDSTLIQITNVTNPSAIFIALFPDNVRASDKFGNLRLARRPQVPQSDLLIEVVSFFPLLFVGIIGQLVLNRHRARQHLNIKLVAG